MCETTGENAPFETDSTHHDGHDSELSPVWTHGWTVRSGHSHAQLHVQVPCAAASQGQAAERIRRQTAYSPPRTGNRAYRIPNENGTFGESPPPARRPSPGEPGAIRVRPIKVEPSPPADQNQWYRPSLDASNETRVTPSGRPTCRTPATRGLRGTFTQVRHLLTPRLKPLRNPAYSLRHNSAGWSSSVARWAHNPEVAGSNPVPATEWEGPVCRVRRRGSFAFLRGSNPRAPAGGLRPRTPMLGPSARLRRFSSLAPRQAQRLPNFGSAIRLRRFPSLAPPPGLGASQLRLPRQIQALPNFRSPARFRRFPPSAPPPDSGASHLPLPRQAQRLPTFRSAIRLRRFPTSAPPPGSAASQLRLPHQIQRLPTFRSAARFKGFPSSAIPSPVHRPPQAHPFPKGVRSPGLLVIVFGRLGSVFSWSVQSFAGIPRSSVMSVSSRRSPLRASRYAARLWRAGIPWSFGVPRGPQPARLLSRFTASVPDPPLSFPMLLVFITPHRPWGPPHCLSLVAALSRSRVTPATAIPLPDRSAVSRPAHRLHPPRRRPRPSRHRSETHPSPSASIAIPQTLSSQSLRAISIAPSLPHRRPRSSVSSSCPRYLQLARVPLFPELMCLLGRFVPSLSRLHPGVPWPFPGLPPCSLCPLGRVCPGRRGLFRTCLPSRVLRVIPGPPVIYEPVFSGALRHPRSSAA
jgi:hypothetical protein